MSRRIFHLEQKAHIERKAVVAHLYRPRLFGIRDSVSHLAEIGGITHVEEKLLYIEPYTEQTGDSRIVVFDFEIIIGTLV